MDVKRTRETWSLVSLDTSQPAIGGKVKRNFAVLSLDKPSHSVVILDEPSNQNQDRTEQ